MDERSAAIIEAQDRLMIRYEDALVDIMNLTDAGADLISSKAVRKLVVRGLAGELKKK